MPTIHTSNLDELVADMQKCSGDIRHPDFSQKYAPLSLTYDTHVDQDLSPYSQEYFDQQVALYEEIAGRKLNQETGELHPYDIETLINTPNPIGIVDAGPMLEHLRSITLMISLADLKGRSPVLDMGAGHGIGSEIMAFTGCRVHAVDIDPALSELSSRRAALRGLDIKRSLLNFDDLNSIEEHHYDAAFFSQSLHHCLRPWELIASLKAKLKPGTGVIGFVGEPINTFWWRSWGIRLDETSLFVARANGWFESGWSLDFIRDCFERNGFTLTMFKGGFEGGDIGIATLTQERLEAVLAKAAHFGLERNRSSAKPGEYGEEEGAIDIDDARYLTSVGERAALAGRPAYRQTDRSGVVLYGPYIDLEPGVYAFSAIIRAQDRKAAPLRFEAVSDFGETMIGAETYLAETATTARLIEQHFTIAQSAEKLELRAANEGAGRWTVSLPTLRRISVG